MCLHVCLWGLVCVWVCGYPCSEVRLIPQSKGKALAIREVKADAIGHLVAIKGIVTRCTDVKPLLQVCTCRS